MMSDPNILEVGNLSIERGRDENGKAMVQFFCKGTFFLEISQAGPFTPKIIQMLTEAPIE